MRRKCYDRHKKKLKCVWGEHPRKCELAMLARDFVLTPIKLLEITRDSHKMLTKCEKTWKGSCKTSFGNFFFLNNKKW